MTLPERLRDLANALPSDHSAVTFTRADLLALADCGDEVVPTSPIGDLTVDEVAKQMKRAPSTVRGWLIANELRGYKLNRREWRVPRSALRDYVERQATASVGFPTGADVDIAAWRKVRGI